MDAIQIVDWTRRDAAMYFISLLTTTRSLLRK